MPCTRFTTVPCSACRGFRQPRFDGVVSMVTHGSDGFPVSEIFGLNCA